MKTAIIKACLVGLLSLSQYSLAATDTEIPKLVFDAGADSKGAKRVSQDEYQELQKQRQRFAEAMESCRLQVADIQDARNNRDTLGVNFSKPLLIQPLDSWLTDVNEQLVQKKMADYLDASASIVLKPYLTHLYAYAENMNIHGIAALRVEVERSGQVTEVRHYRGLGSRTNMWGAVSEYHDAANRAAGDMVTAILADLPNICDVEIAL